jgi:hypothetical protein
MVVLKKLCEEVLGRRVENKIFGVCRMKEECVPRKKDAHCVFTRRCFQISFNTEHYNFGFVHFFFTNGH